MKDSELFLMVFLIRFNLINRLCIPWGGSTDAARTIITSKRGNLVISRKRTISYAMLKSINNLIILWGWQ
jgi:hypothetical protein